MPRRRRCRGKICHDTMEEAAARAAAVMTAVRARGEAHPWPITAYGCEVCRTYHIGHTPAAKLNEILPPHEVRAVIHAARTRPHGTPQRCEVIACGHKGEPYRCGVRGTWVNRYQRYVCAPHMHGPEHERTFTEEDAIRRYDEGRGRGR